MYLQIQVYTHVNICDCVYVSIPRMCVCIHAYICKSIYVYLSLARARSVFSCLLMRSWRTRKTRKRGPGVRIVFAMSCSGWQPSLTLSVVELVWSCLAARTCLPERCASAAVQVEETGYLTCSEHFSLHSSLLRSACQHPVRVDAGPACYQERERLDFHGLAGDVGASLAWFVSC